jgi:hypothetical protein
MFQARAGQLLRSSLSRLPATAAYKYEKNSTLRYGMPNLTADNVLVDCEYYKAEP